jgi:hypothetical protein
MSELIKEVNELVTDIEVGLDQYATGTLLIWFYDNGTTEAEFEIETFGRAACPADVKNYLFGSKLDKPEGFQVWRELNYLASNSFDHDDVIKEVELREFEDPDYDVITIDSLG